MERYKLKTILCSDEDVRVLMESLEHSEGREDLPCKDRLRARDLRERLDDCFKRQGE